MIMIIIMIIIMIMIMFIAWDLRQFLIVFLWLWARQSKSACKPEVSNAGSRPGIGKALQLL